jgi:hypothetical protein
LEKAQYVRRVSPAMILGLEPVPEGMVACIVGLGSECHVEFVEAEKLGAVDVEGSSGSGSPWIKTESFYGDGGRYLRRRRQSSTPPQHQQ